MAFCMNCGNEVPDGTKFCPNCGTPVGSSVTPDRIVETQNVQQQSREQVPFPQTTYTPQPPVQEPQPSGLDKFGKFFGIILLILAVLDFSSDPAILTIILSAGIIAGAVFCLKRKYKLKGFTFIALILAVFCLFAGVSQAKKYGLFTMPPEEYASSSTTNEEELIAEEEKSAVTVDSKSETEESTIVNEDKAASTEKVEEATEVSQEDQPQEKEQTGGVDPDLKAFLDSYEEFVDQYVEFMKKYNSDPNNMVSMLGEYGEMMQKYSDFAEKIDQYDSNSMSTEDSKYYIEVTTRCAQKMLEAY
ncbi:DUF6591 domain-containing protein [Butyrivibrio sp. FCS014]|uniref:DUF6591 domain-containing protein n=1 Tax=Butyrivibrio sp. FCS014 TaxID=1408304 RepID=UPI0004BAE179|nr:DUF6591 domain-containing protein [Butyrivibrio sp. FCS014]